MLFFQRNILESSMQQNFFFQALYSYKALLFYFLKQEMGNCLNVKYHQQGSKNFDKSSFDFKELLGHGAFGKVWKVTHKGDGKVYAVKVMSKNKILAKKCVKSVLLQKKIHEFLSQWRTDLIVNMIASSQDRQKLYLVMQYIQGWNLRTHMKRGLVLQQLQIKYLIYQLLNSLEFIHQKSIIHGDMKPENIILDLEGVPRIMDFGLSNCYSKNNFYQTGGTLAYKTPEVILERNHTQSIDYYAVGIITFELFFQKRPHTQTGVQQLKKQIVSKEVSFQTYPQMATISKEAADFIVKILKKKKQDRLGYKSYNQIKQHPWFTSHSNALQNIHKIKYLEVLRQTIQYKPLVPVESDTENQNLQSVKHLLDRPHIQQRFEAFSFPIATQLTKIQRPQSGELQPSLKSSQIKMQQRKTCEF